MYRFKKLTTSSQFSTFKQGYDSQIQRRSDSKLKSIVKTEYLAEASRPMGCFDRQGRMVAGYVVQEWDPLIIPAAMPAEERATFFSNTPREVLCELTAIWRNDGISGNAFAAIVWPRIILDCITRGKPYILGIGYSNTMNDIYRRVRPRLVYNGPSQTIEDTEVFIYAYSRPILVATYFANLANRKIIPALKFLKRRGKASSGSKTTD